MNLNDLLLPLFWLSIIIWVGGAITGQIWMYRANRHGNNQMRLLLLPHIYWIIRSVYIPMAATAFVSGMVWIWYNEVALVTPWLLFPLLVFVVTVILGSLYSLPEYQRLIEITDANNGLDIDIQRRIETAAWVNRVELLLVLIGIVGVLVQPG